MFCPPSHNCVPEYLPAKLAQPPGCLDYTPPFNPPEHLQQFRRIYIRDGPRADLRTNIRFEPGYEPRSILGNEPVALVLKPFASNGLERVPAGELGYTFGRLFCGAGIDVLV